MKVALTLTFILFLFILLSGCTEETGDVTNFDRIESENFIMYRVSSFNENQLIELIESELNEGNIYVDCISIDVTLGGRSDAILLFEKGE